MDVAVIGKYYREEPEVKNGKVAIEYENGFLVISEMQYKEIFNKYGNNSKEKSKIKTAG